MAELISIYLDHLRERGRAERTIRAYRELLARIDNELPYGLERATEDELRAWIYRDHWTPATRAAYRAPVVGFFRWACEPRRAHFDWNPAADLPWPTQHRRLPRPVTDTQLAHILACAAGDHLLWCQLAAYEGMRCVEISRARREHFTADTVSIPYGKGNKPGVVPTHPVVWEAVRGLPPGRLAAVDAHELSTVASAFLRGLLGEECGLHRLRHWFGTTMYRETKDLRAVQELMRHASPETTAVYTLIADEERRTAIRTLPVFSGRPS